VEDPEKWHFPLKAFIALTTVTSNIYLSTGAVQVTYCDNDNVIMFRKFSACVYCTHAHDFVTA